MLQTYVSGISDASEVVASVPYRCCKSRSECCTCCNGYARMFQVYVPNVSSVSDVCCKCFHLDVAKVNLDAVYTCMLQVYVVFHTYVASVSSGYCICLQVFLGVFASVSVCMLQLLHIDVSKVYHVLHMGYT
jgi:hypothetical protein